MQNRTNIIFAILAVTTSILCVILYFRLDLEREEHRGHDHNAKNLHPEQDEDRTVTIYPSVVDNPKQVLREDPLSYEQVGDNHSRTNHSAIEKPLRVLRDNPLGGRGDLEEKNQFIEVARKLGRQIGISSAEFNSAEVVLAGERVLVGILAERKGPLVPGGVYKCQIAIDRETKEVLEILTGH